ncbi:hypothetical protein K439DRAFT_830017 [Ramaria rubella]|nr:hypothetical protein K439DRAFT_830017 [Ramaria rubella]
MRRFSPGIGYSASQIVLSEKLRCTFSNGKRTTDTYASTISCWFTSIVIRHITVAAQLLRRLLVSGYRHRKDQMQCFNFTRLTTDILVPNDCAAVLISRHTFFV